MDEGAEKSLGAKLPFAIRHSFVWLCEGCIPFSLFSNKPPAPTTHTHTHTHTYSTQYHTPAVFMATSSYRCYRVACLVVEVEMKVQKYRWWDIVRRQLFGSKTVFTNSLHSTWYNTIFNQKVIQLVGIGRCKGRNIFDTNIKHKLTSSPLVQHRYIQYTEIFVVRRGAENWIN